MSTTFSEISGLCDDARTPFQAGTTVTLELWKGKVSKVTIGERAYATEDNPANNASLSIVEVFSAPVDGIVVVAIVVVCVVMEALRQRRLEQGLVRLARVVSPSVVVMVVISVAGEDSVFPESERRSQQCVLFFNK